MMEIKRLCYLAATLLGLAACSSYGDYRIQNAKLFYDDGDYEWAKEQALLSLEERFDTVARKEALTFLGLIYDQLYQYDSAVYYHQLALQEDSLFASAWVNMGITYSHASDLRQADSCYQQAYALDPNDPMLLGSMGALAVKEQRYTAAVEHLSHAVSINTHLPHLHANYAIALAYAGRYEEAHQAARLAREKGHPNDGLIIRKINEIRAGVVE